MNDIELTREEKNAVRTLQRLAKRWPETLWLAADSNSLSVVKCGPDMLHICDNSGELDSKYIVASIDIPSDGVEW